MALVPEIAGKLAGAPSEGGGEAVEVAVQRGAGDAALIPDELYEDAGARLVDDAASAFSADVVVKVAPPTVEETGLLRAGSVLIAFLQPLTNGEGVRALAQARITAFALEAIPRISRAQSMDALSSQSNVAGLSSSADRSTGAGSLLPDADDRGWDDPAGDRAGARRGRGRAAGARDRTTAGRGRPGVRRARRGQGAGGVSRRTLSGVRPWRGHGRRRRVRTRTHARAAGAPARVDGRGHRQGGCGDHDGARPWAQSANFGQREGC